MQTDTMQAEEVVSFLEAAPIRIAVFGEFSAGKTTFLNALIGEDILSVAVDPTTAVPTRVRYGREFNIFVELTGGETKELFESDPPFWTRFVGRGSALNTLRKEKGQIRSFLREWTKEGERADEVERVVVELPLDWLKSGLELVDTPGANNEFTRHQGFTQQEAEDADIAVMLMDVRQGGGKRSEFAFMNEVGRDASRSFVALNKMDLVEDDEEREEALEYVAEEALPTHWDGPTPPPVVGLSALVALEPEQHDEPELEEAFTGFVERIERLAEEERGKILLGRIGNPEQELFERARNLESQDRYDRAHRTWFELLDVLEAAGMDPQPAADGVARCEKELAGQVEALDRLHARYEEALELEANDPDEALARLRTIQEEMQDLGTPDADVDEAAARLSERVEQRDTAREAIADACQRAKDHREAERYIEAASAAEKIPPQLDTAEPSSDRRTELEGFVEEHVQRRDEWAQERWKVLSSQAREHLGACEYEAAAELAKPIETVQPFLSAEQPEAEQLAATIQKHFAVYQSYESESAEAVESCRRVFIRDRVNIGEAEPLRERLASLADRYEDLYDLKGNLPKLPRLNDDAPCLTIDEKVAFAALLRRVTQESRSAGEARELLEKLRERQSSIEAVSLSKNDPAKNLQKLDGYPDHPGFVKHLNELLSSTPGWWTAPFSFSRRIALLEEYKSFWPDEEKVERQVARLTTGKQRSVKVYGSVGGLLLLAVALVSLAFVSEYRQYHALANMDRGAQIRTAYNLYHNSWFYGEGTRAWMQKTAAVPLSVVKRTGQSEDEIVKAIGSWHKEQAVQKLQAGNREGAHEHVEQAPAQSREGILKILLSLETEAGDYANAMRTAENMPSVEDPPQAVQLVASGCSADDCGTIADSARSFLNETSGGTSKAGRDVALSLLQKGELGAALDFAERFGEASSREQNGPFWKEAEERLVRAVERGSAESVRVLLEAGVEPDVEDDYGETALETAIRDGKVEIVRLLHSAGASPDTWMDEELHEAVDAGNTEKVKVLLAAGANPDAKPYNTPLLTEAVTLNHKVIARTLLEAGADPNAGDGSNEPLWNAALGRNEKIVDLLLEHGANPNGNLGSDGIGDTPLSTAASRPYVKLRNEAGVVRRLLAAGADPNVRDENGGTALTGAAANGRLAALHTLLKHGADPNAKIDAGEAPSLNGDTPLTLAVSRGDYKMVRLLLENGADTQLTNQQGQTARDIAKLRGHSRIRHLLSKMSNEY